MKGRNMDVGVFKALSLIEQQWGTYIQSKKALMDIATLKPEEVLVSHPLNQMLLADLVRTLEVYLPLLKQTVSPIDQSMRGKHYNRIYLESFFLGHMIDEMNGLDVNFKKHVDEAKFTETVDVYDVGGGLCYWSDLIVNQNPQMMCRKFVIEKQAMLLELFSNYITDKYPHIKDYQSFSDAWLNSNNISMGTNSIVVVAQFLHLFTVDEALTIVFNLLRKALEVRDKGGKVLFFFIEPLDVDGHLPMFSFRMKEQMRIMKGIKSCANSIIGMIDRLTHDISLISSLEHQIERHLAARMAVGGYEMLPVLIDQDFKVTELLKVNLERKMQ